MIYYNNSFLKKCPANIMCSGFYYGLGYFTTIQVLNSNIMFLDMHIKRLLSSAIFFNLPLPKLNYEHLILHLLSLNNLKNASVKITVFCNEKNKSSIIISCKQIKKVPVNVNLMLCKKQNFAFANYKSLNYLENIQSLKKAQKLGYDDVLFFDNNGVLETSIANIFFVKDKNIITSPQKSPILNGIIRQKLLLQGKKTGFNIYEKQICLNDLPNFDAAFITNCLKLVVMVKKINNQKFNLNYKLADILKGFILDT